MKNETKKADFDLSILKLSELISLHEKVVSFQQYLEENKIETEKKEEDAL
ncbi:MAG: hypothetical protein PHG03_03840 [Bacilli bacterium]|nr:hypothetical protein [Bacilli bacterium]MDD4795673.1 hypothetical protein [Bacilli bacterium]